MNNPLNPYASPTESEADFVADLEEIEFEAIVERADITQVLSRPWLFFGTALIMVGGFALLMMLLLAVQPPPRGRNGPIGVIVFFQILMFLVGINGWNRFGPGIGSRIALRDPSAVGPIAGRITADAIHFERETSSGFFWLKYLTSLRTNQRGVVLTFDSFRSRLFIIPRTAFLPGGFEAAVQRLSQHFEKNPPAPLSGFDPRQTEAPDLPLLLETGDDAVHYEGELLFADLRSTQLQRQLLAGKVLVFLLSCLGFGAATFVFILAGPIEKIFGLVMATVGAFFLYHWFKLLRETRPEQIVGASQGVVDRDGVIDSTVIGQIRYGWWMFQWCMIQDDVAVLRTRGQIQYYILLTRREFASQQHWNDAVELMRENVAAK